MVELLTFENFMALLTLTVLEVTLGIDNIIMVAVVTGSLPEHRRPIARRLGLWLAMGTRILLLLAIVWVMRLVEPLFGVMGHDVSGRDLILLGGGLFLLVKATLEIHNGLEGEEDSEGRPARSFGGALVQIALLDIIFSLDSVITAVGMAKSVAVMIAAIVIAVGVMMFFAGAVSAFIERHPTMKMLALSFLVLIGVVLTADGLGKHIPRGYIYFAMAFSFGVEMINLRLRPPKSLVHLRGTTLQAPEEERGA